MCHCFDPEHPDRDKGRFKRCEVRESLSSLDEPKVTLDKGMIVELIKRQPNQTLFRVHGCVQVFAVAKSQLYKFDSVV